MNYLFLEHASVPAKPTRPKSYSTECEFEMNRFCSPVCCLSARSSHVFSARREKSPTVIRCGRENLVEATDIEQSSPCLRVHTARTYTHNESKTLNTMWNRTGSGPRIHLFFRSIRELAC